MGLLDKALNVIAPGVDGGDLLDVIPGIGDARAADRANAMNIKFAQDAMAFTERMSNSSYQRAMDDMKKAGLNPMLAFSQGGASVPQGVAPTITPASKAKLGEMALSTAMGVRSQSQQQQQIDNQVNQTNANIDLSRSTAAKQVAETRNIEMDTAIKRKELPRAETREKLERHGSQAVDRILKMIDNSAKSATKSSVNPKTLQYQNPVKTWLKNKLQLH